MCTDLATDRTVQMGSDIYIPYVFGNITFLLSSYSISPIDTHTLKLVFNGQLIEHFPHILDQIYLKEEWKRDFIRASVRGAEDEPFFAPIFSIVSENGYCIYPDEVVIYNHEGRVIESRLDPSVSFLIAPESFPRMNASPLKTSDWYVLFFGRHNVCLANPKLLTLPFSLQIKIHHYAFNLVDNQLQWKLPIIFPFVCLRLQGFTHENTATLALSEDSQLTFVSPVKSKTFYGLENRTSSVLPQELVNARLSSGGPIDTVQLNNLDSEPKGFNKLVGLIFDANYEQREALAISTKIGKSPIPLSLYSHLHNAGVLSMPIATTFVTNNTQDNMRLIIECQIEGFTTVETETITIGPHKQERIDHKPALATRGNLPPETCTASLKIDVVRATERGQIREFSKTHPVRLLAKDTMVWTVSLPTGISQNLAQYIACWVRPRDHGVDELVAKAVHRHSYGTRFTGYQENIEGVREQVKALYEELCEMPLNYISRTHAFGNDATQTIQRVLFPKQTLRCHGNCIDLTVLMASLLENIGLNPIIALMPHHAFLGWETQQDAENYDFLESTAIGKQAFYDACLAGTEKYEEFKHNSNSKLINIRKMRMRGILPMMSH
ncbi:MAG: hypothetical protein Q8L35_07070 [Actinomycetota bacterium]|nr:hypothetical protein [Actinomycetota bacterium]